METTGAKPRPRPLKRWAWRLGRIVGIAYAGLAVVLTLLQTQLIFPGAATQGAPDCAVDPAPLDAELVTLATPSGENVVALYGRALDANGQPRPDARSRPTLIYFYGNAMCIAAAVEGGEFQKFRRRGFNVMVPDYLGYGLSSGKPSETGVYATADACFDHLLQRGAAGEIDSQQIVPLGLSLGGGAACYLAATRREIPCVATIAAFTSVDAMARKLFPFLPTGMMLKHHFDNESKIKKFGKPVFLAHGTRDGIIPFAMSEKLAAAATAGGSKVVVKYDVPDGDHNDIYDIGGPALLDAITQFVDAHAIERAQAEE